jgi:hypothetical protein
MTENYIISGYNITTDPHFQDHRFGNTPELVNQLEILFVEAQDKKNKEIIDKLSKLIIEYPSSPQLKNFLSVAHHIKGNYHKAIEVNNWILSEHPDYLFAKLNEANKYIDAKSFDKVPDILGESLDLKQLYPERNLFHLVEVTGYFKVVIRYLSAIGNIELAENRLEILKSIDSSHPDTEEAESFLMLARLKNSSKRWEEENKSRITPTVLKIIPKSKTQEAPKFNHQEIYKLYTFGLNIPPKLITEICLLPRKTLIQDLETILLDAVNRYDYFENRDWKEETHNVVLHAVLLLKEINAEESLINILSFLSYDEDFLRFWLGEHITETIWEMFYVLGFNKTNELKKFLLKPGVYTYIKTAITEALSQMVLHNPEKREEVLSVFTEVFTGFSKASLNDNLIDSDFLGLAICDTIDCELKELLPIIKILFDRNFVAVGICGNYSNVEKDFDKEPSRNPREVKHSMIELYQNILNTWHGYKQDVKDFDYKPLRQIEQAVSNKINRNDPCICGSGLKYKKCCINKK